MRSFFSKERESDTKGQRFKLRGDSIECNHGLMGIALMDIFVGMDEFSWGPVPVLNYFMTLVEGHWLQSFSVSLYIDAVRLVEYFQHFSALTWNQWVTISEETYSSLSRLPIFSVLYLWRSKVVGGFGYWVYLRWRLKDSRKMRVMKEMELWLRISLKLWKCCMAHFFLFSYGRVKTILQLRLFGTLAAREK